MHVMTALLPPQVSSNGMFFHAEDDKCLNWENWVNQSKKKKLKKKKNLREIAPVAGLGFIYPHLNGKDNELISK